MKAMGMLEFEELLEQALTSSQLAWWEWDVVENRVSFNDRKVTMLGYDINDFRDVGYQAFTALLHPEDFERTMQAMRDHLEGRAALYQIDYRIARADGVYTWYMDRGRIIERTAESRPKRLRGLVIDLGPELHQRQAEEGVLEVVRAALPSGHEPEKTVKVCSACKNLQTSGEWMPVTPAFLKVFAGTLSHGLCPHCIRALYPEHAEKVMQRLGLN